MAAEADSCILDRYRPLIAVPYSLEPSTSIGDRSTLRGAQLYVPPDRGLTRERLSQADACFPSLALVEVSTLSDDAGFWVRLTAKDGAQARNLLAWALTRVQPASARHGNARFQIASHDNHAASVPVRLGPRSAHE
jgi:hypothetical protein